MDLTLNNLQRLICQKPTNQPTIDIIYFSQCSCRFCMSIPHDKIVKFLACQSWVTYINNIYIYIYIYIYI